MSLNNENPPFEKAVEELEVIIEKLEEGNLPLDESIKYFERGIELYKYCGRILEKAEGRVKMILECNDGELKEVDFDYE